MPTENNLPENNNDTLKEKRTRIKTNKIETSLVLQGTITNKKNNLSKQAENVTQERRDEKTKEIKKRVELTKEDEKTFKISKKEGLAKIHNEKYFKNKKRKELIDFDPDKGVFSFQTKEDGEIKEFKKGDKFYILDNKFKTKTEYEVTGTRLEDKIKLLRTKRVNKSGKEEIAEFDTKRLQELLKGTDGLKLKFDNDQTDAPNKISEDTKFEKPKKITPIDTKIKKEEIITEETKQIEELKKTIETCQKKLDRIDEIKKRIAFLKEQIAKQENNTDQNNTGGKIDPENILKTEAPKKNETSGTKENETNIIEIKNDTIEDETIKIIDRPLSTEEIKQNIETIDNSIQKKEKEILAKEAEEKVYGEKARELLLESTKREEYGEKIKDNLKKITNKFRKSFWRLSLAGSIFVAATGFTKENDGKLHYDYKQVIKPLIETGIYVLGDQEGQYLARGAWKYGLYDLKETSVSYKTAPGHFVKNFKKTLVLNTESIKKASEAQKLKEIQEQKEYLQKNTYFQKIDEVKDFRASNKHESRMLWRYRNQYANENGFKYVAIPNKGNLKDKNKIYKNLAGVAHFLLDCDVSLNQKHVNGTNKENNHFIHPHAQTYINISKANNHYLPVFRRLNGNDIIVQYKLPNEITDKDEIMSPLRQFNFDDIDFNNFKHPISFLDNINEVTLKKGIKNIYYNDNGTNLIFSKKGGEKAYGQFSGASVVFIFNDKEGNRFIRDFAGSINDIDQEGKAIEKEFNLEKGKLVLGIHDVGSFSAKPVAKIIKNNETELDAENWSGFNTGLNTGGGIGIPNESK